MTYSYQYSRELVEFIDKNNLSSFHYNVNYPYRIDKYGKIVRLDVETSCKLPTIKILEFYAGYKNDPNKVIFILESELTEEDKTKLDNIVQNHKTNYADKYAIRHNDGLVMNPEIPEEAILFDTYEGAQQGIIGLGLNPNECEIAPVVIL